MSGHLSRDLAIDLRALVTQSTCSISTAMAALRGTHRRQLRPAVLKTPLLSLESAPVGPADSSRLESDPLLGQLHTVNRIFGFGERHANLGTAI
jgi:hypothetical protein